MSSEQFQAHFEKEDSRGIKYKVYPCDQTTKVFVVKGSQYKTFMCNGMDLEGLVGELDMISIFRDSILRKGDGGEWMLAALDKTRGSRGFSIGWTGGQCLVKRCGELPEPTMVMGTLRYQDFIGRLSKLTVRMAEIAVFWGTIPARDHRGDVSKQEDPVCRPDPGREYPGKHLFQMLCA